MPLAKRTAPAEDQDDEAPRRSRRSYAADDEDDDSNGNGEAEKPANRRKGSASEEQPTRRREASYAKEGWAGAKELKSTGGEFLRGIKITDEPTVIKFLQDEPFATYRSHWVNEITKGKRSFTCSGRKCPLCGINDKPGSFTLFNIVVIDDDEPVVDVLEVRSRALEQLEKLADSNMGPLSKHYWAVTKSGSGKGGTYAWNFAPIKGRDLQDDWKYDPLTEDEIEELMGKLHTKDETEPPDPAKLQEVATMLAGDDD